jgi:acyltransferase
MRLHWVDSLKGFAIFLVVLGHIGYIPPDLAAYIYSFHMPLFFFISGYLLNFDKYYKNTNLFVSNKIKSIMLPYLFFVILSYLWLSMIYIYQANSLNLTRFSISYIFQIIYAVAYGSDLSLRMDGFLPLWFLPCLFLVELLFFYSAKLLYRIKLGLLIIAVFFSLLGFLYQIMNPIGIKSLPMSFNIALNAFLFFTCGYYFKKYYNNLYQTLKNDRLIMLIFAILHLTTALTIYKLKLYYNIASFDNYLYFYSIAFIAIFFYVYMFKVIKSSSILEFYGKNSMILLGTHIPILFSIQMLFPQLYNSVNNSINHYYLTVLFAIIVIFISIPVITILKKLLPNLFGTLHESLHSGPPSKKTT